MHDRLTDGRSEPCEPAPAPAVFWPVVRDARGVMLGIAAAPSEFPSCLALARTLPNGLEFLAVLSPESMRTLADELRVFANGA